MPSSLRLLPLAAVLGAALALPAQKLLFVDDDAATGGDGSSWSKAFDDLGKALAAAADGDRVWVAAGTYRGPFTVPVGVTVSGGFEPGATHPAQAIPAENRTILTGALQSRVLVLKDRAWIEGFLLRDGRAGGVGGGAVLVEGPDRARIDRCEFTNHGNTAGRGSTVLVRNGGYVQIRNSIFHNDAGPGHMIDVDAADGVFYRLTIVDNKDNGIHCQRGCDVTIRDCIFAFNGGRGICDIASSPANKMSIVGNLFHANRNPYHDRGRDLATVAQLNALPIASQNNDGDPRFLDRARGEFTPWLNGPAADNGTLTSLFERDAAGYPRGLDSNLDGRTGQDRGALEAPPATLHLSGRPTRGQTFGLAIAGLVGKPSALLFGTDLRRHVVLEPIGTILVGGSVVAVPIGNIPASVRIPVPTGLPGGAMFGVQGAMFAGSHASVTRGYELWIR